MGVIYRHDNATPHTAFWSEQCHLLGCHGSLTSTTFTHSSHTTRTDSGPTKRMAMYPMCPHQKTGISYACMRRFCVHLGKSWLHTILIRFAIELK